MLSTLILILNKVEIFVFLNVSTMFYNSQKIFLIFLAENMAVFILLCWKILKEKIRGDCFSDRYIGKDRCPLLFKDD